MSNFNKDEFAELLNKAKGDLSINQYANKCGVAPAHISRLLRCMIDTPPSPEIIRKLSSCAHNGITYEQMLRICGYLDTQYISIKKVTKQDVIDISKEYLSNINNTWLDKELLIKEITELYWKLKFD